MLPPGVHVHVHAQPTPQPPHQVSRERNTSGCPAAWLPHLEQNWVQQLLVARRIHRRLRGAQRADVAQVLEQVVAEGYVRTSALIGRAVRRTVATMQVGRDERGWVDVVREQPRASPLRLLASKPLHKHVVRRPALDVLFQVVDIRKCVSTMQ